MVPLPKYVFAFLSHVEGHPRLPVLLVELALYALRWTMRPNLWADLTVQVEDILVVAPATVETPIIMHEDEWLSIPTGQQEKSTI